MWNWSSPWTVAGSRVRLPDVSERMGRPAASAKETAPELRLTMTCSLAVERTKDAGRSASFQPEVMESWGTTSMEARVKKMEDLAKETRTTVSERSWMRR